MEPVSGSTKPTAAVRNARQAPPAAASASRSTWWGAPVRGARDPHESASALVQALIGEAILRHVSGRRVLDLGHGAPEIAQWVRRSCGAVTVIPLAELDQDGDALRIPAADAAFDAVYCVRTLPRLGRDEASSLAMVRSLLDEAARVTAPGGLLMLEINNPRSLRGLVHGIRNPITVVATGSLVLADERHQVTRYDTLGRLLELAPADLELVRVYGIRVLVPISRALGVPLLGRVLAAGEWWARDSFLRHFGAHLLVVLRKPDPGASPIARA